MSQRQITVNWTFSFTYQESELTRTPDVASEKLVQLATNVSKNEIAHGANKLKAKVTYEVK